MKTLLIIIVYLFSFSFSFAGNQKEGLMFRISGNDLKTPSYILGSFHLIDGKEVHQLAHFDSLYKQAPQICFETEMDKKTSVEQAAPNRSSDKVASSSQNSFKSMDYYIYDEAVKDRKKVLYLEPIAVQDSILKEMVDTKKRNQQSLSVSGTDKSKQVAEISKKAYMKQIKKLMEQITQLRQLYLQGKGQEMLAILAAEAQQQSAVDKQVAKRNEAWVRLMPDMMKQGCTLFVVGLSHVLPYRGSQGLLADLSEMGYQIDTIK